MKSRLSKSKMEENNGMKLAVNEYSLKLPFICLAIPHKLGRQLLATRATWNRGNVI